MKITIYHDQNSIDPSATCTDEQFESVIDSLENEYEKAILSEYPDADIEFKRQDWLRSFDLTDVDGEDYYETEDDIQRILEDVYAAGMFWE